MDNNHQELIKQIITTGKNQFKENLCGILISGSFIKQSHNKAWSDIDLLLILKHIQYSDCILSSNLSHKLQESLGIHVSLDMVSQDIAESIDSITFLHTKSFQTLYEAMLFPNRLIYKIPDLKLGSPSKQLVKQVSDGNVHYFYHEIRKNLIRNSIDDKLRLKETLRVSTRRLFNMLKMSIQSITLTPSQSKNETLLQTQTLFPKLDPKVLYRLIKIIDTWDYDYSPEIMFKLLNDIFNFSKIFYLEYLNTKSFTQNNQTKTWGYTDQTETKVPTRQETTLVNA